MEARPLHGFLKIRHFLLQSFFIAVMGIFCFPCMGWAHEIGDWVRIESTQHVGEIAGFVPHGQALVKLQNSLPGSMNDLVDLKRLVPEPFIGGMSLLVMGDEITANHLGQVVDYDESTITLKDRGIFPRSSLRRATRYAHLNHFTNLAMNREVFDIVRMNDNFYNWNGTKKIRSPSALEQRGLKNLEQKMHPVGQLISRTARENLFVVLFEGQPRARLALAGRNDSSTRFVPRVFLTDENLENAAIEVDGDLVQVRRADGSSVEFNIEENFQSSIRKFLEPAEPLRNHCEALFNAGHDQLPSSSVFLR